MKVTQKEMQDNMEVLLDMLDSGTINSIIIETPELPDVVVISIEAYKKINKVISTH